MERPLDYSGLTTFEIREIVSTIDFHELEKVHKGDTLFECFKYRSVKTIVISDPQKIIVKFKDGIWTAWEWDAKVIEVYDYKWIDGKRQKTKVNYQKDFQHYYVSDISCQGAPKLYTEDIYLHLSE